MFILKLSSGKSPIAAGLGDHVTRDLQNQLHFRHLQTLMVAYTNIWVLDTCSFSALMMCVCVLGGALYALFETGKCLSKTFC